MRKACILAMVTVLLVLSLATVAQAQAAPSAIAQEIYNDYKDNRRLDGDYSCEDLRAYLNDPSIRIYGTRGVYVPLDNLVRRILGIQSNNPNLSCPEAIDAAQASGAGGGGSTGDGGTFPLTGFAGLLTLAGGALLLGGGYAVRRNLTR